jgi:hypothetical protein
LSRFKCAANIDEARPGGQLNQYTGKKGGLPGQDVGKKAGLEPALPTVKTAQEQFATRWGEYKSGKSAVDLPLTSSNIWLEAELKTASTKAGKVAAYRAHLDRLNDMYEFVAAQREKDDQSQSGLRSYTQTRAALEEAKAMLTLALKDS